MIKLREYQEIAVERGLVALSSGKNKILQLPTGSGKSIVIATLCKEINDNVLILQPSKEILEQNYAKLQMYGIDDIGIYSASAGSKYIDKYTYATIGSIYKKPDLFRHFRYVIIDECHLVDPASFRKGKQGMYAKFFQAIGNPRVLGLTATPYRLKTEYVYWNGFLTYNSVIKVLTDIYPFFFRGFEFILNNSYLFQKGYLAPIEYITPKEYIDRGYFKLNSTGAEFDLKQVETILSARENVRKVVMGILENTQDIKHNLIFCPGVYTATKCMALLQSVAPKETCNIVTANTPVHERERIIEDFREGRIKHLFNVNVLSVGFDFPGLDCVTIARPTNSLTLYYQQIGRGIRIDPNNPNKVLRVIDVTRNNDVFGRIETIKIEFEKDEFGKVKPLLKTEKGIFNNVILSSFVVKKKPSFLTPKSMEKLSNKIV